MKLTDEQKRRIKEENEEILRKMRNGQSLMKPAGRLGVAPPPPPKIKKIPGALNVIRDRKDKPK